MKRTAVRPRDVGAGLVAAAAALLAMAGVAAAGLVLLGADEAGDPGALTAAVVALAAGGPATLDATAPGDVPIPLSAGVEVMPLGVTLVGATVLGALLVRRGRDGLGVRGAAATVAVATGLLAVAHLAGGNVTVRLPDDAAAAAGDEPTTDETTTGGLAAVAGGAEAGRVSAADGCLDGRGLPFSEEGWPFGASGSGGTLDVGVSVAGGPAAVAGATGALIVLAMCRPAQRFRGALRGRRAVVWPVGGVVVAALAAAGASGGAAAAGGVVLVLPLAVVGALPIGLGVPLTVRADGVLGCVLDGAEPIAPGGPLMWVSGAALLGLGVIAASRTQRPTSRNRLAVVGGVALVVGAGLATMAVLARVSVDLGVGGLSLLDARLAADPLTALGTGLAAGSAAGVAGIVLVGTFRSLGSVSWRPWKDRARP